MPTNEFFSALVNKSFNCTRLDYWLKKNYSNASYFLLCKLIRKGVIRVNSSRVSQSYILKENDKIKIPKILQRISSEQKISVNFSSDFKKKILKLVFYKDEDIIVINKPPGLAVQGGTKVKNNLDQYLDVLKFDYSDRPKLVHRIDKDTSGVMIIARNLESAKFITKLFKERKIHKVYIAIVNGQLKSKNGILESDLFNNKKRLTSKTHYKVIFSKKEFSILALKPITGRKHQIRKQLHQIGHSIVGDTKYYSHNTKAHDFFNNNMNLHALTISYNNINGELKKFTIPPNNLMENNFNKLNFNFKDFSKFSFFDF